MIAAGLKRTRSPSAASADQAGNELSPAPVQGSSKDIDGADNKQDDDNGWTAVASSSKKKAKKQKVKKQEMATPLFHFDPAGFKHRQIQVSDVRELVLNILDKASHPKWLKITNKAAINGIVMVLVQGIEPATLGLPSETTDNLPQTLNPRPDTVNHSKLPVFQQLFSHYCPTRAPGDTRKLHSVTQTLLHSPIPSAEKNKRESERSKLALQSSGSNDPSLYLLPVEDFAEQGYILPTYPFNIASKQVGGKEGKKPAKQTEPRPFEDWLRPDGFVQTPQPPEEDEEPPIMKIIGIDCEMCITTVGSEVCRVSVVDGDGKLLYDSFVKPKNKIVDYATVYSGITEQLLENVTTTLEDVQRKLAEFIDHNTVLVGHSLNCDLLVLKLVHPWIVDTSVIYHHTRGPPFKASLKWLASKWLSKEIQQPRQNGDVAIIGHNSEEDARAAVELLRLKMKRGPTFGEFVTDQESIFERLARAEAPKKTSIVDHGNPGQWHGSKADTAIGCKSDAEIVEGIVSSAPSHDFVFGRLIDLSHALEWAQPSRAAQGATALQKAQATSSTNGVSQSSTVESTIVEQTTKADPTAAYAQLNENLAKIYASLPKNTAFIVLSGHSDPRMVTALTAKKNRFDLLYKTGTPLSTMSNDDKWMESDERALLSAVQKVKDGMTFLAIKR